MNSAPSLGYGHLPAFTFTWTASGRPEFLLFLPRLPLLLLVPRDAPGAGIAPGVQGGLHSHGRAIRHNSATAALLQELSSKLLRVKTWANFGPSGLSGLSEQLPGDVWSPSRRLQSPPATLRVNAPQVKSLSSTAGQARGGKTNPQTQGKRKNYLGL